MRRPIASATAAIPVIGPDPYSHSLLRREAYSKRLHRDGMLKVSTSSAQSSPLKRVRKVIRNCSQFKESSNIDVLQPRATF